MTARWKDALRLVDAAADCGADCVKFRPSVPEPSSRPVRAKAHYQKRTTDASESQLDHAGAAGSLPLSAYPALGGTRANRATIALSLDGVSTCRRSIF